MVNRKPNNCTKQRVKSKPLHIKMATLQLEAILGSYNGELNFVFSRTEICSLNLTLSVTQKRQTQRLGIFLPLMLISTNNNFHLLSLLSYLMGS